MTAKRERQWAALGSVSSGTMRPEDLIPEFLYVLGQHDRTACDALEEEYRDVVDGEADMDGEAAGWCLEALFEALGEVAPPYAIFGAHEGDGADYGFWVCWESLEEDCRGRDASVVKVDAGDEWPSPLPEGVEYVAEVNDHGNATLFTRDGEEVWSVV